MSGMGSLNGTSDSQSQFSEKRHRSSIQQIDSWRPSKLSFRYEGRVWTRDLLIAIGIALVIVVFFYQPVKIEGNSMAPLLSHQERIFINKFVYHFEQIESGDEVDFWYPLDHTKSFIKRIVALPRSPSKSRHSLLTLT